MITPRLQTEDDAIVIGGGPAGSSFSRTAASLGVKVLMLEKKKDLGTPVRCGEGLEAEAVAGWNLPSNPATWYAMEMKGAKLYSPDLTSVTLQTEKTGGYILERKIFDKLLATEAGRKGAHVLPHTQVMSLTRDKDGKPNGVIAKHMDDTIEFKAPLIISAEGMEAKMARTAGFPAVASLYDTDTCFEYEMVNVDCEPLIELFFTTKFAPRGYVWIFPKGKDVANVGVGIGGATSKGGDAKRLLDEWIKQYPRLKNAEPTQCMLGAISVGAPLKEFTKDHIMVIGTTAHQVDPIHGGGIHLAMGAGAMAARVAAKAVEQQDFSKEFLSAYDKEWYAKEGDKLARRLALRKSMEKLSDKDFNDIFHELSGEDIDKMMTGHYKGVIGRILLKHPGLFKMLGPIAGIG